LVHHGTGKGTFARGCTIFCAHMICFFIGLKEWMAKLLQSYSVTFLILNCSIFSAKKS
jgi:hypothetical protein